jgi:hypothetical protein
MSVEPHKIGETERCLSPALNRAKLNFELRSVLELSYLVLVEDHHRQRALCQASVTERPVVLPPAKGAHTMPITPFLDGHRFDPETKRIMGVAFEMARAALRLDDRSDALNKIVAENIIKLAQEGERDPDELCERTLSFFREQRP